MNVIRVILTLVEMVPQIRALIDRLVLLYLRERRARLKARQRKAIETAVRTGDQRDLERAINSPTAGLPSHIPGTEVRDTMPGGK